MHSPALAGTPPRVGAGVLAGVTAWRLAVAACAFIGLAGALSAMSDPWPALSQQASLFAGVVYVGLALYPLFTGGRAHEPRSPWLRGATAVLLLLVCVTYLAVIDGSLDSTWSMFEHLVTPLAVLADFLLVGRNQVNVRWWHPLTWVVFPAAYLAYFVAADPGLYGSFLDPHAADFLGVVAAFLLAIVAAGYVLYGVAKAAGAVRTRQP
jgi:CDP-diglyceride synthetase